jgi:CHAT domain-containing protein
LFTGAKYTAKSFTEEKASISNIENFAAHYNYLHLATHGVVNQNQPDLSHIYFAQTAQEGDRIFTGDIFNWKIQAELVCLSACETGLGQLNRGEGMLGLTRAFLYAGAKNLVVSLWQANDEATAIFMKDFYTQHLYHGKDLAQSLRMARIKLSQYEEYQDPFIWAPFILIGR